MPEIPIVARGSNTSNCVVRRKLNENEHPLHAKKTKDRKWAFEIGAVRKRGPEITDNHMTPARALSSSDLRHSLGNKTV